MTSMLTRTTDILRGSAWMEKGYCRTVDPDLYFDDKTEYEASFNCFKFCRVREQCLAWALEHNEKDGVWGGLTALERRQITTPRVRMKCPHCSETRIFEGERASICIACGLSWPT